MAQRELDMPEVINAIYNLQGDLARMQQMLAIRLTMERDQQHIGAELWRDVQMLGVGFARLQRLAQGHESPEQQKKA